MRYLRSANAVLGAFCIGAGSLWTYWAGHSKIIAQYWVGAESLSEAASWGDSFGAFNALVGAVGVVGVVATLIWQGLALQSQRQDQHRQRFETSFFELLNLLRSLRENVRFSYSQEFFQQSNKTGRTTSRISNRMRVGQEAITSAIQEMRFWINEGRKVDKTIDAESLANIYTSQIHKRYEARFGPYFRLVYTILDRIRRDSILTDDEKIGYANLLRSQLTSHDISLIAINGLAPVAKDLADLLTEFRLLKYLPEGSTRRALETVYDPQAFAARDK